MTRLSIIQQRFMASLFGDEEAILADIADSGRIRPDQRMQVYRNNARLILTDLLERTFPAVRALTDPKFFKYAAACYIKANPPQSANLNDYGATMPAFLAAFEPLANHPYIADVARLEWARHEAYLEADFIAGDPMALTWLSDNKSVRIQPALRLLRSDWPIDQIWKMTQPGSDGETPDMDSGPAYIVVGRDGIRVFHWPVSRKLYEFIAALQSGVTISTAARRSGQNAESGIATLAKQGLICAVT